MVRTILGTAAILLAASLAGPMTAAAQQPKAASPGQVKRPPVVAPHAPPARSSDLTERLNQNTVAVISGNPNGTYLFLAYDMSAVLDDGENLRILPVVGKGAYQNVLDILHLRGVDLGITQVDVLSFLKKSGEFGPNVGNRLAYITRLYNEEMHVLAGPGVASIQDLKGKKVNFSDAGSGTQFSLRLIFDLLGIKVDEVNMGQADGYEKVKSGEISATILIAGKPSAAFAKFKLENGMKILSVPYTEALEQDYQPAKLTDQDYPGLIPPGTSVDTIAIPSVLAVYNWPRDTDRYRRVALFVEAFFSKFAEFQKPPRHAKWKETNLTSTLKGWTRFPAAEEWLARNAQQQATAGPVQIDPEIVRAQAAKAAPNNPAEQQRLFQQFMEWSKSQRR